MAYIPQRQWPPFSRRPQDILDLFKSPQAVRVGGKLVCGLDLEFDPSTNRATILGLSDGALTVSVPYAEGIGYFKTIAARHPDASIAAHSGIGADMRVLAANGIHLKLDQMEDTIIRHWLANQHLCKGAGKTEDGDEGKRGGGFMNLQTFATLYTSLPVWKNCREAECSGPCSTHDVFGYNAIDTVSCVLGLPEVRKQMLLKGVEKLYPMHRDLMALLAEMTETGVPIDLPYVQTLRDDFARSKKELEGKLPFNPKSPKQVAAYFKAQGLVLEDTTEETLRELAEDNESNEPLQMLVEYKALGNGVDRWFGEKYVGSDGRVHCRIGIFTSTARLNAVAPNLQNVASRRKDAVTGESFKTKVRRAIVAPEGYYLMKSDYSNGENRVMLYHSGYEPIKGDLHDWLAAQIGFKPDDDIVRREGSARQASKTVTHGSGYLEGLQLLSGTELSSKRIITEERCGARIIFPDWKFYGKTVTFTGANLARRVYGNATRESRKKALDIVETLFGRFPKMRELHRRILAQVEQERVVRPPHGYVLNSYGQLEDQCKTAAATFGSQPLAHLTKLALLRLQKNDYGIIPALQIHDEIIIFVPNKVPPEVAKRVLVAAMDSETVEMPGLTIPCDVSFSTDTIAKELSSGRSTRSNWADTVCVECRKVKCACGKKG